MILYEIFSQYHGNKVDILQTKKDSVTPIYFNKLQKGGFHVPTFLHNKHCIFFKSSNMTMKKVQFKLR